MITDHQTYHQPVMVPEVLDTLMVSQHGRYLDCTVGEGGHTIAILEASRPNGRVLGIDLDPHALEVVRRRAVPEHGANCLLARANFSCVASVAKAHGFLPVQGILFDLGLSSLQLETESRGFSFQRPGPLDMRFDTDQELTAGQIVNTYPRKELIGLLIEYGEERRAQRIADAILHHRPVATALELAKLVISAIGNKRNERIHPATRTFQALRITVNRELDNLEKGLSQAISLLAQGARIALISYHSLEDRCVKRIFQRESHDCICPPGAPQCVCSHKATLRLINRKVITPSAEEVRSNPRARSARMRVAERM